MDQKLLDLDIGKEEGDHSPVLHREVDSIDDFEHLGHDSSPLKESGGLVATAAAVKKETATTAIPAARDEQPELHNQINTTTLPPPLPPSSSFEGVAIAKPTELTDELSSLSVNSDNNTVVEKKMDSNLLEMGDNFQNCKETDDKLDKFLQDMSSFGPTQQQLNNSKHNEPPEITNKQKTEDFLKEETKTGEKLALLTDSDHSDDDDFKPSKYQDFPKQVELPESSTIIDKNDQFKDVEEKIEIRKPELVLEKITPIPPPPTVKEIKPTAPPPPPPTTKPTVIEAIPTKNETDELICKKPATKDEKQLKKSTAIDAEAIFCKMGLDTWFHPERLNPKVESLIYWRDPKKSGPIFGGVLLVLLALTYFSLISVIAYLSLLALTGTISFRIYKNVVQAVQKTGDGHPFKEYLEYDVALPQDKVKEISEVAVAHLNAAVIELRRLFLVEDLVDSVKFGVLLWTLTYLGAWFNGMTLIIIAWVALFTLPKVYETNKTQIDANLEIVRTKLAEITSKVKAAIPIGKKPAVEEKKEQ